LKSQDSVLRILTPTIMDTNPCDCVHPQCKDWGLVEWLNHWKTRLFLWIWFFDLIIILSPIHVLFWHDVNVYLQLWSIELEKHFPFVDTYSAVFQFICLEYLLPGFNTLVVYNLGSNSCAEFKRSLRILYQVSNIIRFAKRKTSYHCRLNELADQLM
jgi:hypothetical protein